VSYTTFLVTVLVIAMIAGLVVGSFLNVCIGRIPQGDSIVRPASRCPACLSPIRWYQNVPVVSYLALRGHCAACRAAISFRYPLIELLTGLLFVYVTWTFGIGWPTFIYWVFVAMLVVITFIDLDHQIIPNVISLPGIALGFLSSFLVPWITWSDSLLGIALGGGSLWLVAVLYALIAKAEGMGMGDVKLLAMIGAFLGYQAILPVVLLSSFSGAFVGLMAMAGQGKGRKYAIPFGPFLSLGALVYLFWGDFLVSWYFTLFQ